MAKRTTRELRIRRHNRVRFSVSGTAERPRVAVFRSNKHISVQIIDDEAGRTLVSASSVEKGIKTDGGNIDGAKAVGKEVAGRMKEAGISSVVFDRGGFAYHGRVAALADAMRAEGMVF
ncbi:MAG: 50S ribosomal protein L18 [Actinomycetes bacterium]|jgi:large subunit ribosomal protein L18